MTLVWMASVPAICLVGYWLFMSPYSQIFGRYPYRGKGRDRVVALTFDDGPNEPYTSQIAEYLAGKQIRATFFQVGRCVEQFPETTVRLAAAGHVVGNHSFAHEFHAYLVPGRLAREVARTQEILRARLGRTPALFRSPWLWRQPMLLRTIRRLALQPVSGTFCHVLEVLQPDGAWIARRAIAKTRPGSILVFHDGFDSRGGNRGETVRAVRITAEALLRQGYRFVTVDELLGTPAYQEDAPAATRTCGTETGRPSRPAHFRPREPPAR
jgi:peptidoglycan/xylan/chitin deacetylase (PgdA/CDA1 family)